MPDGKCSLTVSYASNLFPFLYYQIVISIHIFYAVSLMEIICHVTFELYIDNNHFLGGKVLNRQTCEVQILFVVYN